MSNIGDAKSENTVEKGRQFIPGGILMNTADDALN